MRADEIEMEPMTPAEAVQELGREFGAGQQADWFGPKLFLSCLILCGLAFIARMAIVSHNRYALMIATQEREKSEKKGNVVSCCWECKQDNFTPEEMEKEIGPAIRRIKLAKEQKMLYNGVEEHVEVASRDCPAAQP